MPGADFLSLVALGQAALIALLLLLGQIDHRNRANLFLAGFFGLTVLDLATEYAALLPVRLPETASMMVLPLFPLFPVLLWFYVLALTSEEAEKLPWFLPHLGGVVMAAVCIGLSAVLPDEPRATTGPGRLWRASLGIHLFLWLWAGLLAGYLVAIMLRLRRYRRRLKEAFSNLEGKELRWIDGLIGAVLVLVGLKVVQAINLSLTGIDILPGAFESLFELALVLTLGVFGLRQQPTWEPATATAAAAVEITGPFARYAKSALSAEDCTRIMARLGTVMQAEKPWLDPFLKLRDLAVLSGISENRISQALSTAEEKNFYAYVNGYRVNQAKQLLSGTDKQVFEILLETGFNSKSTFNAAFKNSTGQTPTQFRRTATPRPAGLGAT